MTSTVPDPVTALAPNHPAAAPDPVLAAAVDLARAAAADVAGGAVDGAHLGVQALAGGVDGLAAVHAFAASVPGYTGWHWAVSLARVGDSDHVTVDEVVLLPGDGALLAPAWVPWAERVRPGDLGPGDLLPGRPDDPRLVPAYAADDDDPQVHAVAHELGLGRERVMSREGRLDTADRWQAGERGPRSPMAKQAPAACGTCGFLLPLAGSLRAGFGVCGNDVTETDGQVVSVEYGCGAHSQVAAEPAPQGEAAEVVYDDGEDIEPALDRAPEAAVAVHDRPAEQAEDPAGEAGPEPDAVVVAAEPAPEGD